MDAKGPGLLCPRRRHGAEAAVGDVEVVGQVCQRGERRTLVFLVVATLW